jgi:hypothetical protein
MKQIKIFTPTTPPDTMEYEEDGSIPVNVFLGGTIDNGNSDDWQNELINSISNVDLEKPVRIYNPRRKEWPSSDDHREISRQINWELANLEATDVIVMNILADSKSPISLMEIGLFASTGKLMVFCPKTYYRYDNVMVVCQRFNIPLHTTNNIPYITEKVCEKIGIDQEAMKKRKIEEERQELLHMKKDIDALIHDGNTEWMKLFDDSEVRIGWYEKHFMSRKKEFEEKYGEPLFLENELN